MTVTSEIEVAGAMLEKAPVRSAELELPVIGQIASLMMRSEREEPVQRPCLLGPHDERIELPDSLYRVLRDVVERLRKGESVSIFSADEELTSQEAADALNVSRPYLVRLLDSGEIPCHRVGTHRRVRREDLEHYRGQRDQRRRSHLRAMVREAEEAGLYDVPEIPAG
jgi:excisionase family DNA binding protein